MTDKSGNEIHLDTTGSNINITAPETMTFNCKNLNINVRENMTTSVGQNITTSAGADITESAAGNRTENSDKRTEIIDNEYFRGAENVDMFAKKVSATSTEEDMLLQSNKILNVNSGEYGTGH